MIAGERSDDALPCRKPLHLKHSYQPSWALHATLHSCQTLHSANLSFFTLNKSLKVSKSGRRELPLECSEKQTHAPQAQGAKSCVCKTVKNESFHLCKMNTSDLVNVSPRGKEAHADSQTGFSW